MRISTYIYVFSAVVFAAPAPVPDVGQKFIDDIVNAKQFVTPEGWAQSTYWEDCGDKASGELHYPALDAYAKAAREACSIWFKNGEQRTGFGYRRLEFQVPVYDWPTSRKITFTYWQRNHNFPGQKFTEKECVKGFLEKTDGDDWDIKRKRAPCIARRTRTKNTIIMRWGWKSKKHVEGRADIQFWADYK